jgi:hypothetical protein
LLDGLPLETQSYETYEPSGLQSVAGTLSASNSILELLRKAGILGGTASTNQKANPQQALILEAARQKQERDKLAGIGP